MWSGAPTEVVDFSWDGWEKKTFQRQFGKTKGSYDSYWYTPQRHFKLRSMAEVRRFREALQQTMGDEVQAHKLLFQKKR